MVCAAEVWASPASKHVAENMEFLCIDLRPGRDGDREGSTPGATIAGQLDEIRRNLDDR
jgi:hypothetical protein